MRLKTPLFGLATLALSAFVAASPMAAPKKAAPAPKDATTVSIDAGQSGPLISRHIFGQFAEHLGYGIYGGLWVGKDSDIPNTRGIRNDVVAALKEIKVPNVRWPGGCFADEYNWRRGIGAERKPAMNANWGGVIDPNSFGTDEFFDFADQIGAEAYVSVNIGSGTPMEAAEWMEYMTASVDDYYGQMRAKNGHPEPYKVHFLGLGNESWGCGGSMSADEYAAEMKRYARFSRNFNPNVPMKRIAVGPGDAKTIDYTESVMKAWKNKGWEWNIEGISLHNYTVGDGWPPHLPSTDFGEKDYARMLNETLGIDKMIRDNIAIMDKYDPEKKVGIYVDEWGAWLGAAPGTNPGFLIQQNSQRDAVLAALNINIFARHADRVHGANIAQMINVLQAMILTDGPKMVRTPTFYVFKLYVPFQDATLVPVTFEKGEYRYENMVMPRLDVIAAKDKNGTLWVSITNLDPHNPATLSLDVTGQKATKAIGETLTAPFNAYNTFDKPMTVSPKPIAGKIAGGKLTITVAPSSVTVVSVKP